jgi:nucleotide-binding universal stress UspA family protein
LHEWWASQLVEGSTAVSGAGRVIVGVSGSPGSIPALRYAENAARRDEAPLVAVHAWIPPGGDIAERRCPSYHLRQAWQEAARQRLHEALDAAWGCIPAGLDLELVIVRGETGPALVDLACNAGDLLVVGAGQRGRLARISHGKVSRYCVAHAVCPVSTVPPPSRPALRSWSLRHRELTVDQAVSEWQSGDLGRENRREHR